MSDSFILSSRPVRSKADGPRPVLITGAAGRIGAYLAQYAHERYKLTLMVHPDEDAGAIEKFGRVETADLADIEKLKKLFAGHDTIVHLAADPSPEAVWDDLLPNNIVGTYHALVAAKAAGCRRVVYASSIHAVSGYPDGRQVQADDPVSPGDLYGVSKCFGEAMCRYMATQQELSCIAIRIGAFQPLEKARQPESLGMMDAFVSHRDLAQLICCCIDDERLCFAIVNGLSDNRFNRLDISEARELLAYQPQDDLTRENPMLKKLRLNEKVSPHDEGTGRKPGIREEL